MLSKILQDITHISDNNEINSANYIEGINYINNLYSFINKLKVLEPLSEIEFHATFKGKSTCEKYGIDSTIDESTMKYLIISSPKLLEDYTKEVIIETLENICQNIEIENQEIKFILK